mmetsp:Transcript_17423/g.35980  ORF Transcript_17423/g.35980 Transcript_17423/m.35980 type:complete len:181 (-) Transcript_17423:322-864(-)|eukprot:CAMPEP_0118646248 /NCGR_PEP_ID=MMETSP0785-20121206/7951_1 /TAXON_ID=91992 /ORGANISM="Bolidomonas pacifica, Strain CCMP 1866" /LENGTH=180 /DNA_ID=CAMNT_0006538221 /DNA_START=57 /DNA_END=599 /DNA_ORIENTATION=+
MSGKYFNIPPPHRTQPGFPVNPNEGSDHSDDAEDQDDNLNRRGPNDTPSVLRIYTRQMLIRSNKMGNLLSTLNAALAAASGRITGFYGVEPLEDIFELRIVMESTLRDLHEFMRVFQQNENVILWNIRGPNHFRHSHFYNDFVGGVSINANPTYMSEEELLAELQEEDKEEKEEEEARGS